MKHPRHLARLCTPLLLSLALAPAVVAQEVRLISTDGFIDFTGTLVSFEDDVYTLQTSVGTLTFPAGEVTCEGDACPEANEVASAFDIVGSPAMLRVLLPELLDSYSLDADTDILRNEGVEGVSYQLLTFDGAPVADVALVETVPDGAAAQLAFGDAALAIVPGRFNQGQAELLGTNVAALARRGFETRLALDAFVVKVGADAGIDALRAEEIVEIFSGEITNWSELGGADLPISLFVPEEGSDAAGFLEDTLLRPARKRLASQAIRLEAGNAVEEAVTRFPNGIAVSTLSAAGDGVVAIANACDLPVRPSRATVKTGLYPFPIDYHLYASPNGVPLHARGLADFAASPLGQELVSAAGLMDLQIAPLDESATSYGSLTEGAVPLSMALSVSTEGAPLDGSDLDNLDRLAELIRAGRIEGNDLMFIAVAADGQDAAARDAARASLRALFGRHGDVEEQLTVAFSMAIAPASGAGAACVAGNRDIRVEIWAKPLPESG